MLPWPPPLVSAREELFPMCDKDDFIFLAISKWEDRKGYDHMLEAYRDAFTRNEKVTEEQNWSWEFDKCILNECLIVNFLNMNKWLIPIVGKSKLDFFVLNSNISGVSGYQIGWSE